MIQFFIFRRALMERRQMKTELRDLRSELKAALYEKIEASPEERKRIFAILRRAIDEIRGKQP